MEVTRIVKVVQVRQSDDKFTLVDAVVIDKKGCTGKKIFINFPPHIQFSHPAGYSIKLQLITKKFRGREKYDSIRFADEIHPILEMRDEHPLQHLPH